MKDNKPSIIVTGGSGGIGQALVATFEKKGWHVITLDKQPLARNDHLIFDVSRFAKPKDDLTLSTVAKIKSMTNGMLKAIVHNAAVQIVKSTPKLNESDWNTSLDTNLNAAFWLAKYFLDELAANKGSFLAISSIHEKLTKPGFVAYATSKAALAGLMRSLAVDQGHRVRFNAIAPAAVDTPMLRDGLNNDENLINQLKKFHPSHLIGTPSEVARLAATICNEDFLFLNGACIDLSGGISSRLHDPA